MSSSAPDETTRAARRVPKPRRAAFSVVAIVLGALTLLWYALIFGTGGLLYIFLQSLYQVVVWVFALGSLITGYLGLRSRSDGLGITGFTFGVVAALVAIVVGLFTGFQVIN